MSSMNINAGANAPYSGLGSVLAVYRSFTYLIKFKLKMTIHFRLYRFVRKCSHSEMICFVEAAPAHSFHAFRIVDAK